MSSLAAGDSTMVRPTGTIIAAPAPCSTRIATSIPRFTLAAQPTDARVNSAIAVRNTTRFPYRLVSQPDSGISTARVSRYTVMTRPTSVTGARSARPICGAAVLVMVPSSISMK